MKDLVKENIPRNSVSAPFQVTKILIVDDDSALTEVLEELFNQIGYRTKAVNCVDNIIKLILEFQPDLILLDYLLPFVNGGELCSQIKRNKSTSHLPVIIFSAYPKVLLSLGDYGCDAFIAKPFDLDSLIFHIEKCLEHQKLYLHDKLI